MRDNGASYPEAHIEAVLDTLSLMTRTAAMIALARMSESERARLNESVPLLLIALEYSDVDILLEQFDATGVAYDDQMVAAGRMAQSFYRALEQDHPLRRLARMYAEMVDHERYCRPHIAT